jgi:hypothetical protein
MEKTKGVCESSHSGVALTLENGDLYYPDEDSVIHCPDHDVSVRWGDLDGIQRLAVAEGIDIDGEVCILCKTKKL